MWQAAYPFFKWHNESWLGQAISGSIVAFPIIETIHILAMAVMFGAMLALNIKLLGLGFKNQPISLLSKTLLKFLNGGLLVMLISGYMMFASEANKDFSNDGFKFKMGALAIALLFQIFWYRNLVKKDNQGVAVRGLSAAFCFFIWFCVGAGGRAIGFV